jgi:cbb3-type cytochrome oxidase subunit 3
MAQSQPRPTAREARRKPFMLVILLEALLALLLLLLIVWWTMFSGRNKGEPIRDEEKK